MDLGRNDLIWGGTTVATSSSSVVNARWGSSTPLPDFPISGNDFPISAILLIPGYREIISRYREIISRYRKMRLISRYRELFPDIGKLNSRYQKIIPYFPISEIRIPDIGKSFPDIGNSNSRYQKIISDIGKCWIKTQMAFHINYYYAGQVFTLMSRDLWPPTGWLCYTAPMVALETIRVVYIDKVSPRLLKIELNKTWAIFLQTRIINEPNFKTGPNVFQIWMQSSVQ